MAACRGSRSHSVGSSTHGFEPSARGLGGGAGAARGEPGPVAGRRIAPGQRVVGERPARCARSGRWRRSSRRSCRRTRRRSRPRGPACTGAAPVRIGSIPRAMRRGVAQAGTVGPRQRRERVERAAQVAEHRPQVADQRRGSWPSTGPDSRSSRASGTVSRTDAMPSLSRPSRAAGRCAAPRARAPASGPARRARDATARSVAAVFARPASTSASRRASAPDTVAAVASSRRSAASSRTSSAVERGGLGERRVEVAEGLVGLPAGARRDARRRSAAGPGGPCACPGRGR